MGISFKAQAKRHVLCEAALVTLLETSLSLSLCVLYHAAHTSLKHLWWPHLTPVFLYLPYLLRL